MWELNDHAEYTPEFKHVIQPLMCCTKISFSSNVQIETGVHLYKKQKS